MDSSSILYVVIGVPMAVLILLRPIIGLILIIVINQFSGLIETSATHFFTVGRAVGIFVTLGWLFRYLLTRKSEIPELMSFNIIPLLFVVSAIVSTLLSPVPELSLPYMITIIFLILMFYFIQDFMTTPGKLRILIFTIALSGGVASVIGILQYIGFQSGADVIGNVSNYSEGGGQIRGICGQSEWIWRIADVRNTFSVFLDA